MDSPLLNVELPGIPHLRSGKVRELFDLGSVLLMVATDRISAFDCILPDGIPGKGRILTTLSHFWFDQTADWLPNHRVALPGDPLPPILAPYAHLLDGRSMIVQKAEPLPVECVVRGWLAGSGWKEYLQTGMVCGIRLPDGLQEGAELPVPIFTPATKATTGHDENISFESASKLVEPGLAHAVRDLSLRLYGKAREYARTCGLIIADTKFEFGLVDGKLILIDEVLTPDSSRFWPMDQWEPGKPTPSFDKQFLRDHLEQCGWNKQPPAPPLPSEVICQTANRYQEALIRLTHAGVPMN